MKVIQVGLFVQVAEMEVMLREMQQRLETQQQTIKHQVSQMD